MNDVNAVIDNLANKLGVASEVLIPAMSRFYIAKCSTGTVISAIIVIACIIGIIKVGKYIKAGNASPDYFDEDPWTCLTITLIVIGLITLIVFIFYLSNLVGFLASPMGATINTIIENLSK